MMHGQPVAIDPNLAAALHVQILTRHTQGDAGGQFACPFQLILQAVAHVGGIALAIDVKRIAGEGGEIGGR